MASLAGINGGKAFRRGFTLIELMVVLLILSLVLAILLPAIGGARTAAKKAATMTVMKDLSTAAGSFKLEKGINPGYFSAAQMGSAQNATRGFSTMKNIMLDLAGGVTTQPASPGNGVYDSVGPVPTGTITVDVTQIGAASGKSKAYFQPRGDTFVAFNGAGQQVATAENAAIPDVVDAWGNPILAWVQDDRPAAVFSALDSTTSAKFYWNTNAGFLKATSLGKSAKTQRFTTANDPGSLIGEGAPFKFESLAGLLGNPAFPVLNSNPLTPSQARGTIIFHSAGPDGTFLGTQERGGKIAIGGTPAPARPGCVEYSTTDPLNDFDDLVQGAGN